MKAMEKRILDFMNDKSYVPLKAEELAPAMEIEDDKLKLFFDTLRKLERDGRVILSKKKRYCLCQHMQLLSGRIEGKSGGYAFFIPDAEGRGDLFLPSGNLHGALHNDRVLAKVVHSPNVVNGNDEGEVVRILHHANSRILGYYVAKEGGGVVYPEDNRIVCEVAVPKSRNGGAEDGDVVIAEVASWSNKGTKVRGKVSGVIGRKNEPGMDMETVIRKFQLPEEFPPAVLENAAAVAKITPKDLEGRRDLRNDLLITIDGEDARDLDDAVSLTMMENGHFLLGVHIADVGHYVTVGSPLDKEAYSRGTSVYFPDRVIPMLPKELSNGICSLNPKEDRLTLSCTMEIDRKGRVVTYDIFESVICSAARMTYRDVNAILAGDEELREKYAFLVEMLEQLDQLRAVLTKRRQRRGALNFDFPEAKVILDEAGEPLEIRKRVHGRGEQLIEECMIVANETVAGEFYHRDIPFIYRVHDCPPDDKMLELQELIAPFGLTLSNNMGDVRPGHFQSLLAKSEELPEKPLLEMMILRTMSHALYDTENRGHFGLASDCYTHFTSPIRRYPDLSIHRVIKDTLHFRVSEEDNHGRLLRRLEDAALQSSTRERLAEEAEREATDIKKARYMAAHIDEEFTGIISGVVSYGFFVELENTVDGFVHVSALPKEYFSFHANSKKLVCKKLNISFRMGDAVRVKLVRVNVDLHHVDFEFIDFVKEE